MPASGSIPLVRDAAESEIAAEGDGAVEK